MIYQTDDLENEYGKIGAATAKKMLEEYGAFTQSIIQSGNFKAATGCRIRIPRLPYACATQDADDRRSVRGERDSSAAII